jgi:hypothetical protein
MTVLYVRLVRSTGDSPSNIATHVSHSECWQFQPEMHSPLALDPNKIFKKNWVSVLVSLILSLASIYQLLFNPSLHSVSSFYTDHTPACVYTHGISIEGINSTYNIHPTYRPNLPYTLFEAQPIWSTSTLRQSARFYALRNCPTRKQDPRLLGTRLAQ